MMNDLTPPIHGQSMFNTLPIPVGYMFCDTLCSERVVSDCERMQDVLQRWGQQGEELRYILRHQPPPGTNANMLTC